MLRGTVKFSNDGFGDFDPWNFIQANVFRIMSKVIRSNKRIIDQLKTQQETKLHLKYSGNLNLRSHSD